MQSFTLRSTNKLFARTAWYLPPINRPQRIAIFLDAEYYVDQMNTPALLEELQSREEIPPTACLFISNLSTEDRHHDYTCSDPFADFISKDIVPWLRKLSGVSSPGNHLISGVSLSGLQAAYTSLCYPHVFSRTLSQSGSFWWENEWLTKHLRELPQNNGKYWLSVGTKEKGAGLCHPPTDLMQEVDQDLAIENFAAALGRHGGEIHHHLYEGGHDSRHWKDELPDALRWLLDPGCPTSVSH